MLTEKLDIYSMGNIFWAMLGRDVPFIRDDTYKGKVLKGERPKVDPSWHKEFVEVGGRCQVLFSLFEGQESCFRPIGALSSMFEPRLWGGGGLLEDSKQVVA